jgi:hypothetical protein
MVKMSGANCPSSEEEWENCRGDFNNWFSFSESNPLSWKKPREVWFSINGFQSWKVFHIRAKEIDFQNKRIYVDWETVSSEVNFMTGIKADFPYFAYNVLEELMHPMNGIG